MTATNLPSRPDPTRTGAVWVTGTGAFLLLAAAAVFTAMRWDQIPDAAKLGALGLATAACLVAGRGLRTSLPASAGVLFHLGAFLVPLDVVALGVRADLGWEALLLAQGLSGTIVFGWAAAVERSVVLRWAFAAAVVGLAAGIGATTAVPAPLVLAGASVAALLARRPALAGSWAVVAGLAPLAAFVAEAELLVAEAAVRLGLVADAPLLAAVCTGAICGAVLAAIGRQREDAGLVLVGVVVGLTGVAASWTEVDAGWRATAVALATTFLAVELVALATRRDPFWSRPSDLVARTAEWLAAPAAALATGLVLVVPLDSELGLDRPDAALALTGLVLAGAWLTADRRRGATGSVAAALAAGASAVAGVELAGSHDLLLAAALATVAALGVLSGHRAGPVLAVAGSVWATVVARDFPAAVVLAGTAGSLLVSVTAVRVRDRSTMPSMEATLWTLAGCSLLPGAAMVGALSAEPQWHGVGLVVSAVLATAVAAVLDRAVVQGPVPLGTVARVGAVGVLALAAELPPLELGVIAIVVAALSIGDSLRLGDPRVAIGASVAVPVAIGALAHATGLALPATGVALTIGAAVLAGLGTLLGRRWALPVGLAVGMAAASGLVLASAQRSSAADAVMVVSGIGLAAAVERRRLDGVLLASLTLTAGVWARLDGAGVTASEPYLLPVAVLLLGAGLRARSLGTSSWIAYGPVVALTGGAALAERLAGGPGWHALVAGGVGVVSVAIGGWHRLAAPLLLGTGLLVALVGYETVAITAGLPTWTWLALGGVGLLAAGVAMERHDLGPIETGRRLVDVVDERFS